MSKQEGEPVFVPVATAEHPYAKMKACEFVDRQQVRVNERRPRPLITDPRDAIVRITHNTICGSDLHLYHKEVPKLSKGDIIGHEGIGYVVDVGSMVHKFKKGDRVTISAVIACGACDYCKRGYPSLCDNTNPCKEMEEMYGHRIAGLFGYSHFVGGHLGLQAEYARVPIADNNLLKIPNDLSPLKAVSLSDITVTSWHANDLGEVREGDTVAGPIGLLSQVWAKFRGAKKIFGIDCVPDRLELAANLGSIPVDFTKVDVIKYIKEQCPKGVNVGIEAAGYRYEASVTHKIERHIGLETDASDTLCQAILLIEKAGRLSIVGDFFGTTNHFPIGPLMEKGITVRGGQLHVQKWWPLLLQYVTEGKFDPSVAFQGKEPFENISKAYRDFDAKKIMKPLLFTRAATFTSVDELLEDTHKSAIGPNGIPCCEGDKRAHDAYRKEGMKCCEDSPH